MNDLKGWHKSPERPAPPPPTRYERFMDGLTGFLIKYPVSSVILAVIAISPLSYALALVGEPRAVWIWRDILGLI